LSKLLFSGRILFLTGANHRKRDEHRKDKNLFHIKSKLQLVLGNSKKANGRPTVSQTKLNAGSESGVVWSGWGLFLPQSFIRRIEHERVIGIGGMTQRKDFSALSGAAMHESFRRVHKFYAGSRAGGIKIGTSAA
jgi:hypothetical protein